MIDQTIANTKTVSDIEMDTIFSDPGFNCRGSIAPVDVVDLSRDIEKHGLHSPILLKPIVNGESHNPLHKYKIVSGHRRHMAHRVLGKKNILAFIEHNMSEERALIINLGENLQRRDLNILQEAKALERLKLSGFNINEVSQELGRSNTWVRIRYELLELPPELQEAAAAGFIKQTQISSLHKIKNRDEQILAARKIKKARVSGEKVPQILAKKRVNMFKRRIRDKEEVQDMMEHVQDAIGNNFGTRCMAWMLGNISSLELYQDVKDIADKSDIPYSIPSELAFHVSS